jgi:O-antigen/teichoic acid export membrane protein
VKTDERFSPGLTRTVAQPAAERELPLEPAQPAGSVPVRNGLWSSLASLTGAIAGLLGSVVIVRGLTPDEYGSYSYYLWLGGIVSTVCTLALPNALTKIRSELRGERQDEQAGALSGLVVLTLISINGVAALIVFARSFAAEPPDNSYQLVIAAVLIPLALTSALRSHLWADQRYRPVSMISIAGTLIHLAMIGVAVWRHWHVAGYLAAAFALNAVQCVGLLAIVKVRRPSLHRLKLRFPERPILRRYLTFAIPAALVQITDQLIWQRSGVFFLERNSTLEQVGYYSLAYTSFSLFLMLGWALIQGFYPAISHDFGAGDWDGVRRRLRQAAIIATLYSAPICLGSVATLPILLPLVYGEKVGPSIPVAQILFLGLLPGVVTAVVGLTISAIGGIWLHVRLGIISATVSVIANLILVPRLGAVGGAIANTLAQLTTATLLLSSAYFFYRLELPWRRIATVLALGIVSTLLLPTLIQEAMPDVRGLILAICTAAAMYAVLTWRLGYLRILFGSREAAA